LSINKNTYFIVFTDLFTKYAEIFVIAKMDAETIAEIYIKEIICRYGTLTKLLSDRGRNFIGDIFTRVCKCLGVNKLKTSSFYPQTNRFTEYFNKTLGAILKMFIIEHQLN
jgi:hypothetical protein